MSLVKLCIITMYLYIYGYFCNVHLHDAVFNYYKFFLSFAIFEYNEDMMIEIKIENEKSVH